MIVIIANLSGLMGTLLVTVPVLRDGRHKVLFSQLGKRAKSPQLVEAIQSVKQVSSEAEFLIHRQDLRLVIWGLGFLTMSFVLNLVDALRM